MIITINFQVYGPLMLTVLAIPFIIADIVRHILQDERIWKECERAEGEIWGPQCTWSSSQYRCTLPHQEHRPSGKWVCVCVCICISFCARNRDFFYKY